MKKEEINKKLENGILDLWSRDLVSLVEAGKFDLAVKAAAHLGMPGKEINRIIQEYKRDVKNQNEKIIMKINKSDQELIDKIGYIHSEACPENVSDKEVAKILNVSEEKVKSLWKIINTNSPKEEIF